MKRVSLVVLLLSPTIIFAQLKFINRDLTTPEASILFYQSPNRLAINGQNDLNGLSFTSTKSEIKVKDNYIVVKPTKLGLDTICIFKNNKLLSTNIFKINTFNSPPYAQLAFSKDSSISINKVLANPILSVKVNNSIYVLDYQVTEYEMLVLKKNNEKLQFTETIKAYSIPEEILKKLSVGDKLQINQIKIVNPEGDIKFLEPITIIIR